MEKIFMSVYDQIADASMLAKDQHCNSHREWLLQLTAKMYQVGSLEKAWAGETSGAAIRAEIDHSRWIARCPYCGHAEAVDSAEKIFYCMNCNMADNQYKARPVEFPDFETIRKIESLLLERPMKIIAGPTQYERIVRMQPIIYVEVGGQMMGLGRSWSPSQSVDELRAEQEEAIKKWKVTAPLSPSATSPQMPEEHWNLGRKAGDS